MAEYRFSLSLWEAARHADAGVAGRWCPSDWSWGHSFLEGCRVTAQRVTYIWFFVCGGKRGHSTCDIYYTAAAKKQQSLQRSVWHILGYTLVDVNPPNPLSKTWKLPLFIPRCRFGRCCTPKKRVFSKGCGTEKFKTWPICSGGRCFGPLSCHQPLIDRNRKRYVFYLISLFWN